MKLGDFRRTGDTYKTYLYDYGDDPKAFAEEILRDFPELIGNFRLGDDDPEHLTVQTNQSVYGIKRGTVVQYAYVDGRPALENIGMPLEKFSRLYYRVEPAEEVSPNWPSASINRGVLTFTLDAQDPDLHGTMGQLLTNLAMDRKPKIVEHTETLLDKFEKSMVGLLEVRAATMGQAPTVEELIEHKRSIEEILEAYLPDHLADLEGVTPEILRSIRAALLVSGMMSIVKRAVL